MQRNTTSPKKCYSIDGAVKATDYSRARIYKFISSGDLEIFKVGHRTYISDSALTALVDKAVSGAFADEQ